MNGKELAAGIVLLISGIGMWLWLLPVQRFVFYRYVRITCLQCRRINPQSMPPLHAVTILPNPLVVFLYVAYVAGMLLLIATGLMLIVLGTTERSQ